MQDRDQLISDLGEIFREFGFAGTSLSEITARTGLGKGSLYHFFPNGKTEMAEAVLHNIDTWFQENVFIPLRESDDSLNGIFDMFDAVNTYFDSGNRICLVGAFALDNTRDQFLQDVSGYFTEWIAALAIALRRSGFTPAVAKSLAEDTVLGIQGALVLARSQDDPKIFIRTLKRLQQRIASTENA